MINGTTNLRRTALPNIGNDPNDGYGWVGSTYANRWPHWRRSFSMPAMIRQSLQDTAYVIVSASQPRHVCCVPHWHGLIHRGVNWLIISNLSLTGPDGRVYVGNRWRAGGPPHSQFSDPLPTPAPATPFEAIQNVEQIVIPGVPTLPPGEYVVEVRGGPFRNNAFQTFPGQPFALVFVGSGDETRFGGVPGGPIPVY